MKHKNTGYSVVVSLFIVGFLLVVTSGVFHLVLSELNDNRGRENYLRAIAGAEGALELALLDIKDKGYGYYGKIEDSINNKSVMLSQSPGDFTNFKANDISISYQMNSKVNSYSGTLDPLSFDILPLFFIDESLIEHKVEDITLITSGVGSPISWNIISDHGGISGQGDFSSSLLVKLKTLQASGFEIVDIEVGDFLSDPARANNYLILFNPDGGASLDYSLSSGDPYQYFTTPRAEILSSSKVGKYKQNFRTVVDNTSYLGTLKYSIFSN